MTRKSYTNAEKKEILIRAMAIGVGKAAKEYDMSYQTLLNWWKKKEEFLGDQSVSGSDTDEKIQYVEAERKVEEEKKQLLNALMESGKSIDEIMAFLNAGE